MSSLTKEILQSYLNYSPDTGLFTWLSDRNVNAMKGNVAGHHAKNGYIRIHVNGKKYLAHRLAWLYMTGEFPPNELDHIDHNKTNNSWRNLRLATRSQNMWNLSKTQPNRNGFRGIKKNGSKYQVRISEKYYGTYDTIELAAEMADFTRQLLHQEFAYRG